MGQSGRRGRDEKLEILARQEWSASASAGDRRWLGAVADEIRGAAGTVIARQARPSRWFYVVVEGRVGVAGETIAAGRCVSPTDGDIVANTDALLLAVPSREESELQRRFPALDAAPVPAPVGATPACPCPVTAAIARARRRQPVPTR